MNALVQVNIDQGISQGNVPKMNENHDIIGDYDAVPLEYAGFCPVALVSGQGFILPGNRRIGFLRFEGMLKKHTLI